MSQSLDASSPTKLLFLSYSRSDKAYAQELKRRLLASPEAQEAGLEVWLDLSDMPAGEHFSDRIDAAIQRADAFTVLFGADGIKGWVNEEVQLARAKKVRLPSFRVIPTLIGGRRADELPDHLQNLDAVADPLADPDQLAKLLRAVLGTDEAGPLRLTDDPFPGLRAMTEEWADRFFGRAPDTEDVIALLRAHPAVAIVADSGAGKSSLARAGVVPAWRKGALATDAASPSELGPKPIWHVVTLRPADRPLERLRDAVAEAAQARGCAAADVAAYREAVDRQPLFALRCGLNADAARTLLVLDQAEELVTLTRPDERAGFGTLLAQLVAEGGDKVKLLVACRADYVHLLRGVAGLGPLLSDEAAAYRLKQPADLAEIVREPLRLAAYRDGDDQEQLIARLRKDLSDRPGDLALAQMALSLAWRDRSKHGGKLLAAYAAHGGALGALGQEAERVAQSVPEAERALLLPIFVRLVRLSDVGGAPTRRVAKRNEFSDAQQALIDRLASADYGRLLQTGAGTVDIAHEALITQWATLHQALQDQIDDVRSLGELMRRADQWAEAKGDLAGAAELKRFSGLAGRRREIVSDQERDYLRRSRRRRTTLQSLATAAALVIVALAGAAWTFYQKGEAERETAQQERANTKIERARAEASEKEANERNDAAQKAERDATRSQRTALALLAKSRAETDPVSAIKLILSSWPKNANDIINNPTVAYNALRLAFQQPRTEKVINIGQNIYNHDLSDDGKLLTVNTLDNVALINTETSERIINSASKKEAKVSSNNNYFAFAQEPTAVTLYNIKEKTTRQLSHGPGADINSFVFSSDSRFLLTSSSDTTSRVFDVSTGIELKKFIGHQENVHTAKFSSDDRYVVTTSDDMTVRTWDMVTGKNITLTKVKLDDGIIKDSWFLNDGSTVLIYQAAYLSVISFPSGVVVRKKYLNGFPTALSMIGRGRSVVANYLASDSKFFSIDDDITPAPLPPSFLRRGGVYRSIPSINGNILALLKNNAVVLFGNGDESLISSGHASTLYAGFSKNGSKIIINHHHDGANEVSIVGTPSGYSNLLIKYGARSIFDTNILDGADVVAEPSGKYFLVSMGKTVAGYNLINKNYYTITSCRDSLQRNNVFSNSGDIVATYGGWGRKYKNDFVCLWRAFDGKEITRLIAQNEIFNDVQFIEDDHFVRTVSSDGLVRIWRTSNGELVSQSRKDDGYIEKLSQINGGTHIIIKRNDGLGLLYNTITKETTEYMPINEFYTSTHGADIALIQQKKIIAIHFGAKIESNTYHIEDDIDGVEFFRNQESILIKSKDAFTILNRNNNQAYKIFTGSSTHKAAPTIIYDDKIVFKKNKATLAIYDNLSNSEIFHYDTRHDISSITTTDYGKKIILGLSDGSIIYYNYPFDINHGNILQIACQWLPMKDGKRDLDVTGLAKEIGIDTLDPIEPCETYNPPLPDPNWTLRRTPAE